eukprot:CAMPEP_0194770934 /NCGR_PEP_ID=MMETSP0323_2-20130528/47765_1 /TAXON_ID=2866 ORGANISM="Crypthecodinium cohnii, Strain Seligo" /NCGR_SAMPLE_ID=MMETSP0323_2 /ASSEMBLY_ACC=CAM_ASM_000346 /LENGTH=42 /DNA_ID= /DNA_START= /DNA_END= /DNA_ORIENTATION=
MSGETGMMASTKESMVRSSVACNNLSMAAKATDLHLWTKTMD